MNYDCVVEKVVSELFSTANFPSITATWVQTDSRLLSGQQGPIGASTIWHYDSARLSPMGAFVTSNCHGFTSEPTAGAEWQPDRAKPKLTAIPA
jgi:hypothetical protein